MNDNINNGLPPADPLLQNITDLPAPKSQSKLQKYDRIIKMAMAGGVVLLLALVALWWFLQQSAPVSTDEVVATPVQPALVPPQEATESPLPPAASANASSDAAVAALAASPSAPPADDQPQQVPKSIEIAPVNRVDPNQLPSDPALLKEVHDKEKDLENRMSEQKKILEKQLETSNNIVKLKNEQIAELEKQLGMLDKAAESK